MNLPVYWKNSLERISQVSLGVKRGVCSVLTKSHGGRDIYLIEYGEKQDLKRQANFNSALYYGSLKAYADKTDAKPIMLIIGATHGGEVEGIAAILNLITELETGVDLRGCAHAWVKDMLSGYRVLIIPCLNPDGRARVPFEITPLDYDEMALYKQGRWNNGVLGDYENSGQMNPVLGAMSHMGGYYNDGGVNLYADNFFSPMAPENRALLSMVDEEAPDIVLMLHTGCHRHAKFLQPFYVSGFINECVMELDERMRCAIECAGYTYYSLAEHVILPLDDTAFPPPRFAMETAVHLSCGALCVVYESNDGSLAEDSAFHIDSILDCHFILFEQAALYGREFQKKCAAPVRGAVR